MLNPVKGFDEDACEYQKQAGTKPADDLAVDGVTMAVAADLPICVNPQTADDACYCADNQHEIGKAEVHTM